MELRLPALGQTSIGCLGLPVHSLRLLSQEELLCWMALRLSPVGFKLCQTELSLIAPVITRKHLAFRFWSLASDAVGVHAPDNAGTPHAVRVLARRQCRDAKKRSFLLWVLVGIS